MYKHIEYMTASETMSLEEANERLVETTVYISRNKKGKYRWFAIMDESLEFDALREAYNDAVDYINNYGC